MRFGWRGNAMDLNTLFRIDKPRPRCIGTGLITLDIVINNGSLSEAECWAGGSCGNVLTTLSYLGWKSYPIARLGNDAAGKFLVSDMAEWGVDSKYIYFSDSVSTPIIVERLSNGNNKKPSHKWQWVCPNCGSRLPPYKPIPLKQIKDLDTEKLNANVFYFDRVTQGNVELAKISKNQGAIVFFEPSRIRSKKIFEECLSIADIVKYSRGKYSYFKEALEKANVPLEIETLGDKGIHFRRGNGTEERDWKTLPAYRIGRGVKDTAGAGDWCSAGIIHALCRFGRDYFEASPSEELINAINLGQALAALKCYFTGARGLMYYIARNKLATLVQNVWEDQNIRNLIEINGNSSHPKSFKVGCSNCANG
jgi:fructokinase